MPYGLMDNLILNGYIANSKEITSSGNKVIDEYSDIFVLDAQLLINLLFALTAQRDPVFNTQFNFFTYALLVRDGRVTPITTTSFLKCSKVIQLFIQRGYICKPLLSRVNKIISAQLTDRPCHIRECIVPALNFNFLKEQMVVT
jgi:hypothetical protein